MKSIVTAIIVIKCVTTQVAAAQGMTPTDDFEEDDAEIFDQSEEDWNTGRSLDLAMNQGERRDKARHAVLISVGEASPWNAFGIRGMRWRTPSHANSLSIGVGRTHQLSETGMNDLVASAQNLGVRTQWWFSQNFPLAVVADAGLHRWTVRTRCVSGADNGVCSDGKLTATGGSLAAGLMLSWLSENRLLVEWTILSAKVSRPWKQTWSGTEYAQGQNESRDLVTNRALLNIANLSLGLYF